MPRTTMPETSYASGTSTVPLLGETIGANLDRTAARFGDREALVDVRDRPPLDLPRARRRGRRLRARALAPRRRRRATGSASGRRTAPSGSSSSTRPAEDRRDPGQHQPGLPHPRAGLRAEAGRHLGAGRRRRRSRPATTGRWSTRSAATAPTLREVVYIGDPTTGTSCSPTAAAGDRGRCSPSARRGWRPTTRSTSSTPRARPASPRARRSSHHNILNNGFFVGEGCGYTEPDRICVPVPFYHCFGMVMGNLGVHHATAPAMVIPAPGFDPAATLQAVQDERCTSLYGVPTMFIAELALPDFADYDLSIAAHRDHGRLAVPGRGDEAGDQPRWAWPR